MSRAGKRKRRWLQFSLRTLLVAMAVFAVWLGFKSARARRQRAAVDRILELGGIVMYDYEYEEGAKPPAPDWLRQLLGDEYFLTVEGVALGTRHLTDDDMEHFEALTELRVLRLPEGRMTDAGLAKLKGLTRLTDLELSCTPITDQGLAHLSGLVNLKHLRLQDTEVKDEGLAHLKNMKKLEQLCLGKRGVVGRDSQPVSEITDAGLVHLEELKGLKRLTLYNTKTTEVGKQRLEQALPALKIADESRTSFRGDHGSRFDQQKQRWVPEE